MPHRENCMVSRSENFGGDEQALRWQSEASSIKLFFELIKSVKAVFYYKIKAEVNQLVPRQSRAES